MGRVGTLIAALILLLLAGCGGGSEESAVETIPTLSQEDYEAAFDEAASATGFDGDPRIEPTGTVPEKGEAYRQTAEDLTSFAEELRELGPPDEIAEEHDGYVEFIDAYAERYDRYGRLIGEGDERAVKLARGPIQLGGFTEIPGRLEESERAFADAVAKAGYDLDVELPDTSLSPQAFYDCAERSGLAPLEPASEFADPATVKAASASFVLLPPRAPVPEKLRKGYNESGAFDLNAFVFETSAQARKAAALHPRSDVGFPIEVHTLGSVVWTIASGRRGVDARSFAPIESAIEGCAREAAPRPGAAT